MVLTRIIFCLALLLHTTAWGAFPTLNSFNRLDFLVDTNSPPSAPTNVIRLRSGGGVGGGYWYTNSVPDSLGGYTSYQGSTNATATDQIWFQGNEVYGFGLGAGSSMSASNVMAVFSFGVGDDSGPSGWVMNLTNSLNIYNFGDGSGVGMTANDSNDIFGFGDGPLGSATITNSYLVYGFGSAALSPSTIANANNIYAFGTATLSDVALTDTSEIYGYGNSPLNSATITGASSDVYGFGTGALGTMTANDAYQVYGFGPGALASSVLLDSSDIFGFGNAPFQFATITNSSEVYGIGTATGNSMSSDGSSVIFIYGGSYDADGYPGQSAAFTNTGGIYLFGDGPGNRMTVNGGEEIFGFGENTLGSAMLTDSYSVYGFGDSPLGAATLMSSSEIYGFGNSAISLSLTNVFNVYGIGLGDLQGSVMTDSGAVYSFGDGTLMSAYLTNSYEVFAFGDSTLASSVLDGSGQIYGFGTTVLQLATLTNSSFIYGFGAALVQATLIDSDRIYGFGNDALSSATLTRSADVYGIGATVLDFSTLTDSYYVFGIGDATFSSATVTESGQVYGFGDGALSSAVLTTCQDLYGIGDGALSGLTAIDSYDIYGFGFNPFNGAVLDHSWQLEALGTGFENSLLTNSYGLVAIGYQAATGISGSFTNVVFIGDGSTATDGTANALILGTGMSSYLLGDVIAGNTGDDPARTTNYLYIPMSAGVPVGTPVNQGGRPVLDFDVTGDLLYAHSATGWHVVGTNIWYGTNNFSINPTDWRVPYRVNTNELGDTGMHPTNGLDMVFDGKIYFQSTNYLYGSGYSLNFKNDSSSSYIYARNNAGSARIGVNATGDTGYLQAGSTTTWVGRNDGRGLIIWSSTVAPSVPGVLSLGDENNYGLWNGGYIATWDNPFTLGGYSDGALGYSRLQMFQSDTNSPFTFNLDVGGDAGTSQGFLFTNGVVHLDAAQGIELGGVTITSWPSGGSVNPTSGYLPFNSGGTFADSPLFAYLSTNVSLNGSIVVTNSGAANSMAIEVSSSGSGMIDPTSGSLYMPGVIATTGYVYPRGSVYMGAHNVTVGVWTEMTSSSLYVVGYGPGTLNSSFLHIWQPNTNSPFTFSADASGTTMPARGFLFTNGVLHVDATKGIEMGGVTNTTWPAGGNFTISGAGSASSLIAWDTDVTGHWTNTLTVDTLVATNFYIGTNTLSSDGNSPSAPLWNGDPIVSSANPSASVGLSAVNGSSASFMRADAAPALDQSISPTWTGQHVFDTYPIIITNGGWVMSTILGQALDGNGSANSTFGEIQFGDLPVPPGLPYTTKFYSGTNNYMPAVTIRSPMSAGGQVQSAAIFYGDGTTVLGRPGGMNFMQDYTGSTNGFLNIPCYPGLMTNTPVNYLGTSPIYIDTLNNKLVFYNHSDNAWHSIP